MSGKLQQRNTNLESSESLGKHLFRQAWTISQRLDSSIKQIKNCGDLFCDELASLRKHLRDKCEQIILLDCSQRRKAEELLWKKVFYEVIQKCRQHKTQLLNQDFTLRYWLDHITTASSYYTRLINKLGAHYELEVSRLDASSFDVLHLSDATVDWLKGLFYRSYIYLGDIDKLSFLEAFPSLCGQPKPPARLHQHTMAWSQYLEKVKLFLSSTARYQQEITGDSLPAAVSSYHTAMMIDPIRGTTITLVTSLSPKVLWLPGTVFNQMAALMGDRNHYIDAVYYYMRSLSSPDPFAGAEMNLKQIYDKNSKKLQTFLAEKEGKTSEDEMREFVHQRLLLNFISLHHNVSSGQDIPVRIQQVENDLTECLNYNLILLREHLSSKSNDEVSAITSIETEVQMLLPCELLLKLVSMTILTSHSLRLQGSSQTQHITRLVLSLCSLICKYTHDRLWLLLQYRLAQGEPHSVDVGKTLLDYVLPNPVSSTMEKHLQPRSKQTKSKSKRHKEKKPNRRRRKLSNLSSSESESEGNRVISDVSSSDDSLVCDFEENVSDHEAGVDLLESLSDSSDKETVQPNSAVQTSPFQKGRRQIVLAANFSSSQIGQVKDAAQLKSDEKNEEEMCKAVHKVCDLLVQEDCLVMMKIFSDWLQTYPAVIATCAQSVPQLWSHLAQLLNILPTEAQLLSVGLHDPSLHNGVQVISLAEDVALRGFAPFVRCQESINYTLPCLSGQDQVLARLFRFHRLGLYLSNLKTAAAFSWNGTCYIGPAQKQSQLADLQAQKKQKEEDKANVRRSTLMKTMAHLRLQTEVAALQQIQCSTLFTPYLVPDASTLSASLHFIKKLLKTEQFVVIIPTAVIEMLDSMKKGKENYTVRDTIKFLERELKSGNKFLHAQKPEETFQPLKKSPKQDILSWQLHSLLDCAIYFNNKQQQTATSETGNLKTMVTVLLDRSLVESLQGGQVHDENQQKMLEMITNALQYGIDTDTAALFYSKWQHSRQS